ncbi:MAG: DUF3429 domain-containing protein [Litorilituus sp.]|jgi:hypothetical protein|nr:DUF3429 domain-containing protein [Litorilituus sp.]
MKIWQWLGYFGLTPFLACLWLVKFPIQSLPIDPQQAFLFYSAIILSFLSGTLWPKDQVHIKADDQPKKYACASSAKQVMSNSFCLYAFFCLFLPCFFQLFMLPLGYMLILLAEYILFKEFQDSFTVAYCKMRAILTISVVFLHFVALNSWF